VQKQPFKIAVPEETLSDLRERLAKTRWPDDFANDK
jgi:epoxide hydrolase